MICTAPLFYEGVAAVLANVADVRRLPTFDSNSDALLKGFRPDAVVVDSQDGAAQAEAYAREADVPLVVVSRGGDLEVLRGGHWDEAGPDGESSLALRNLLVASIFSGRHSASRQRDRQRGRLP